MEPVATRVVVLLGGRVALVERERWGAGFVDRAVIVAREVDDVDVAELVEV